MRYVPVHKKTGRRYPAITDHERSKDWSRPPYSTNFSFEAVEQTEAKEPVEAKRVAPEKPTKEEEKGNSPA